jgi:hypothetical protein
MSVNCAAGDARSGLETDALALGAGIDGDADRAHQPGACFAGRVHEHGPDGAFEVHDAGRGARAGEDLARLVLGHGRHGTGIIPVGLSDELGALGEVGNRRADTCASRFDPCGDQATCERARGGAGNQCLAFCLRTSPRSLSCGCPVDARSMPWLRGLSAAWIRRAATRAPQLYPLLFECVVRPPHCRRGVSR